MPTQPDFFGGWELGWMMLDAAGDGEEKDKTWTRHDSHIMTFFWVGNCGIFSTDPSFFFGIDIQNAQEIDLSWDNNSTEEWPKIKPQLHRSFRALGASAIGNRHCILWRTWRSYGPYIYYIYNYKYIYI